MYETFYGLRERPFDLTSDSRFMLLTNKHRETLTALKYGISGRKGLTLLIGEAGTGKTTVIRRALDDFQAEGHRIGYLSNPTLTPGEFMEWLTAEFGLNGGGEFSKARFLRDLTSVLIQLREQGRLTGLIVDEAQCLPIGLLEEIRLLSNIETATEKLFPVVLAAQPEIVGRLNEPALRQLKQRVALRSTLLPLDGPEVAAYLAGRIQRAGGSAPQLFTREAVQAVTEHAGGIPLVVSVICDNALIHGLALGQRPVSRDVIEDVCKMLDLPKRPGAPAPAARPPAPPPSDRGVSFETVEPEALTPRPSGPPPSEASSAPTRDTPAEARKSEPEPPLFRHFAPRPRFFLGMRSVFGARSNSG